MALFGVVVLIAF